MKKFLQVLFITLGVIFTLLLAAGVYLYVADPYGIKPIINSLTGQSAPTTKETGSTTDKNPLLSPAQEQALEQAGIDPAALPTNITPAMATCFFAKLGATRANEIKSGAQPTAAEYFTARACFE